jgi:hypothetical protein
MSTKKLALAGRGCAKNPIRDLAALAVLEERGKSEALSDARSAVRKGLAYVMLACGSVLVGT